MRLGSIEEFTQQTRRRIVNADAAIVVVDPELEPFLRIEPGDPPMVRLDELRGAAGAWERPPEDPDSLAVLQFTSGSTDDPKGVMLPHRNVIDTAPRSGPTTSECRGCRSTTTWASSGC
jgi:long-subunit acyl-CoA synthetase (AMP-forming)